MDALRQALTSFTPLNDEEARDKEVILSSLQNGTEDFTPNVFNRSWPSHFTTSAWVVDPSKTQTLMVYHNIYNSWSWIGGHADGDTNLTRVAMRELKEETGLQEARLISDDIFFMRSSHRKRTLETWRIRSLTPSSQYYVSF